MFQYVSIFQYRKDPLVCLQDEEYIQQLFVPQLTRQPRQYRLCLQHKDLPHGNKSTRSANCRLPNCQSAFTFKFYCFIIQQTKLIKIKYKLVFPQYNFSILKLMLGKSLEEQWTALQSLCSRVIIVLSRSFITHQYQQVCSEIIHLKCFFYVSN